MPLRRRLSRKGNQECAVPENDKGNEKTSVSGRKSSFSLFRSFSMSLPTKENRRFSIPSQKKKPSCVSQEPCLQPLDSNRHQVATEELPDRETKRSSTPNENLNSLKRKQAGHDVRCLIQVQDSSNFRNQSSLESIDGPSFDVEKVSAITTKGNGMSPPQEISTTIPVVGPSKRKQFDMDSISELSESPRRYGLHRSSRLVVNDEEDVDGVVRRSPLSGSCSASTSLLGLHRSDSVTLNPPSSPLLMAVRRAVDSLNQYDDFDIIEEIGSGFFADVFKVRHTPTGQLMVLKRNKKKNRVGLLKEVELLKSLHHPNILHYVGACIHEGQLHPLTEYISGGTLEDLVQSDHVFPWSLRIRLSLDIAKGMEYLHNNHMLHRDLNSHNVLLRSFGLKYTAVVADFGLAAKNVPSVKKLTRAQSVVGTPFWMAPEVLNSKPYNETADVFSYGIVLCEIISRLSADPDDIPRTKDYGLDREGFKALPQVRDDLCPAEFMELAFSTCKLVPSDRPLFEEIKAQLYMIRNLHNYQLVSQDSLDCFDDFDDVIQPQPPIRLSLHREYSASPSHLLDSPTSHSEYVFPVLHPRTSHEYSSSQPKSSSPLNRAMVTSQLQTSKSVTIV